MEKLSSWFLRRRLISPAQFFFFLWGWKEEIITRYRDRAWRGFQREEQPWLHILNTTSKRPKTQTDIFFPLTWWKGKLLLWGEGLNESWMNSNWNNACNLFTLIRDWRTEERIMFFIQTTHSGLKSYRFTGFWSVTFIILEHGMYMKLALNIIQAQSCTSFYQAARARKSKTHK